MIIKDIIAMCNQEGVELGLNGDNLDIAFDDHPSDELIDLLRNNKQNIIEYILKRQGANFIERPVLQKPLSSQGNIYSSYSQDMLWFMDGLSDLSSRYNMSYILDVYGELNIHWAEQAFSSIIEQHLPLRTNFATDENGKITPSLQQSIDFKVEVVEITGRNQSEELKNLETFKQLFFSRRFSLNSDLMVQVAYTKVLDREGLLLINMHHIASDGWSLGVLINEFKRLYLANEHQVRQASSLMPFNYSDYAYWQRHCLTEIHEKQLSYWQNKLENLPTLHSLPIDKPRPLQQEFTGNSHTVLLNSGLLKQLTDLAVEQNCTLFMVLHSVFSLLLSKISYNQDIVIGTLLANRTDKHLETLIGFFANTVVLRTEINNTLTFNEFLSEVKHVNLCAQDHQDVPFEKVVERINPKRSQAHTPLCQVMMALDNTPKVEFNTDSVKFAEQKVEEQYALFDLFLKVYQKDNDLSLRFNYSTALFESASIMQMADSMVNLLQHVLQNPDAPISELSCLPLDERNSFFAVSKGKNCLIDDIPQIQTLFEQQVIASPDRVALRFGEQSLTYNEVNIKGNLLAHKLRKQGVSTGTIVALYCERSVEMIIGIIGILKSGASYLPLEPSYPEDRLLYILENSGCKTILVSDNTTKTVCFNDLDCIHFSAQDTSDLNIENTVLTDRQTKDSLAYIIYTSGSTGLPKGVMITHENLINRINWMQNVYQLNENDIVLHKTPFSFDVSVWEYMWPLCYGGCTDILPAHKHTDPQYVLEFIQHRKISILHFVPSMFRHLLDEHAKGWSLCNSVRHVFCSGEVLTIDLVVKHLSLANAKLHNLYGPTEATIDVSFFACNEMVKENVPIGKAIQNTQLYILDAHGNPLPHGSIGELHIGGEGVAKGYINNAELTNSKFIIRQDAKGHSVRLYKTGDLARSDLNGDIHYLGRLDKQVKIRGFRVELGEIEQSILQLPDIKSAVVTNQKDDEGNTLLIAYIVIGNGIIDDVKTIEKVSLLLKQKLPSYMLPNEYIPISDIPVTANGKLNFNALPKWQDFLQESKKIEPVTESEIGLAKIWADVLSVEVDILSVDQSFFSYGGNSLNLIRLKSKIEKEFSVDIPAAKLFDTDTLSAQAEMIEVFIISQSHTSNSVEAFVEEF